MEQIIEFRRFMRVLKYAQINIPEEKIRQLAAVTNTYYEFKTDDPDFDDFQAQFRKNYGCVHMNVTSQSEEDIFHFKGIVYDRLLLAIRDTVLLPEEIYNIRREYLKEDPNILGQFGQLNNLDEEGAGPAVTHSQLQALTSEDHVPNIQNKEEEEEMKRRSELSERLYEEKLKHLHCLPLMHYPPNSLVTYNSYNALLNLLEISKKDPKEASLYTFKGVFLQRTYLGANIEHPNIIELHRKFFQSVGGKGNIFSQLDIIFKNMCNQGMEELDFNSFFAFWSKNVSGNDQRQDVQLVFDDIQVTKNGFITAKDMYFYFQSYELVFLYQKRETDTHVMIGIYNNQTEDSIVCSEICPTSVSSIKSISFTSKKHTQSDQKCYILHSLKQSFRTDKNDLDLKAFEDYIPEQNIPFETIELNYSPANPQPCLGLEVKVSLLANQQIFGNHHIDYALLNIKPLYKADAEASLQTLIEINTKDQKLIGPIKVAPQIEANSPVTSPRDLDEAITTEKVEEREQLPAPDPNWNQGKFFINVNRCTHCDEHTTTTWHDEVDFIEKFNHFGDCMKACFPNSEIIGNHDKPGVHFENFDVYVRGVGPEHERDEQGRIWLYTKNEGIFSFLYHFALRILQAYDKLVLLASGYGDTIEMEKVQEYYLTRFESMVPKKWSEYHTYPCDVPKRKIEIQREIEEENSIKEGTKMVCKNWGCGIDYDFSTDPISSKIACRYHPGSYQLGSIHALWPESWTCCRGEWSSRGCKRGPHRGIVAKKLMHLCLNVGEINPKTKRPDSACGSLYSEDNSSDCLLHPGYFKRNKVSSDEGEWTCCQDGNPNSVGCQIQPSHKRAEWPDPEAKKYFVEKQISNPGLNQYSGKKLPVQNSEAIEPYKKAALRACVYRDSIPYIPFVNQQRKRWEERKLNENEFRICMRHGCCKKIGDKIKSLVEFTDVENDKVKEKRKKNCFFHPGNFDFGHTGVTTVSQASTDTLWKPHWTCCRQEWDSVGCKSGFHDGPLRSEFVEGLAEKAKHSYEEWKRIEEQQKTIKLQEKNICDRYIKDEKEKNNELGKLPQRYNEDIHQKASELTNNFQLLLDQSKKNPRMIIDFYEKEFWPNPRAQKKFQKQISLLWKNKLDGYKIGALEVKGLQVDENDIRNIWSTLFKKEESVSFGRLISLCDKLHLHMFAVSDRLDYHFKFWDMVNKDLTWFTNSDSMTREQFIEWWFMEIDTYLEIKENYKEELRRKQYNK